MRVPRALFAFTAAVLTVQGEEVSAGHHRHGHKHHGHKHHHKQHGTPEQPTASAAAAVDARAAANEANEVAVKSVGVTEHAQSALKVARNALRDARASSGGMSDNQKKLLKDAEGQLRDAGLSAEYGKLQQAQWLKAKGHYIATKETSLKKLEDRMTVKSVTSSNVELESLRLEIEQLKAALDAKTVEKNVKYADTAGTVVVTDDKSDVALRAELAQLEQMIQSLEAAESAHQTTSGPSHDELKAEAERLRMSIDRLEAEQIPASNDVATLKIRVRELERERDLRAQEMQLRRQLQIAHTTHKLEEEAKMRREMEILAARKHILEQELGQKQSVTQKELLLEIKNLHIQIDELEHPRPDTGTLVYEVPAKKQVPMGELSADDGAASSESSEASAYAVEGPPSEDQPGETPVRESGIDIDTAMPYGELEPFGREDTAQELTEDSVRESDEMVDQLERAEVSEEKRAVFRALTRLRGAAITSFDGVARSQTGNIDEYNKLHKWRRTHPLHHLADEESDISKWAFPDNADF